MSKHKINKTSGITLIALVVTIIVLLILAGISIQMITGENGILTRAAESKERTEEKQIIEEVKMDILAQITDNNGRTITEPQLKTILKKYFNEEEVENIELSENLSKSTAELTSSNKSIKLADIYNGTIIKSYVGYYADLNGDEQITLEDDGVVFIDLAVGASGTVWGQSYYLDAASSGLKQYEESGTAITGDVAKFGEQKWIKTVNGTTGKNRFYVMALKDIDNQKHFWYLNAYNYSGKKYITEDGIGIDANNKAVGRKNTEAVMEVFNKATDNGGWGEKATGEAYTDMFEVIETKYNSSTGWFVPSRNEWAAFADATMVGDRKVSSNYSYFGLNYTYWLSSQDPDNINNARLSNFDLRIFYRDVLNTKRYVRLCTVF